jgi:hypothetical protein
MLIASFRNYTICISGNDPFAGDKGIAVEIAFRGIRNSIIFYNSKYPKTS